MTFAHYLNHMSLLTNQWSNMNYKDPERQRIYLKDIDCPPLWHEKLQSVLPYFLYYLNDSTGDFGGFGAVDEPDPGGPGIRRSKGIAKAGDLMSCLPKEMRAENMMCYVGHEGTYTPAHREMCASLGQNIMVEASTGMVEDGKPTKPGSSVWFMAESKERAVFSEYWLSRLGHDIEVENHFAQVNAWKNAPFKTYVVEQKPGDFILIPPLAPHQVWNRGTRTMKVAWNRTTVETLEMALDEALPRARLVCRDEQYKNKAIIYFALQKYSKLLKTAEKFKQKQRSGSKQKGNDIKVRQLEKDFRRLHGLFGRILVSESFLPQQQEKPELVPYDGYITCSYCRCNIFNRFLTCTSCVKDLGDGDEDTYDICMECYAMGRSCACISKLKWVEQFLWSELAQRYDQWRLQILAYDGKVTDKSPMSLKVELERLGRRRTLAQICQLELKRRPWRDVTKPPPVVEGVEREEEIELDINGNVKKKKKVRRSEKFIREHGQCHTDRYWEPKWKQAACSQCGKGYCYGTLFRAYDMMPQDILADPDWKCPSCRNICGCRHCRKKPGYKPYAPSATMLGHNTRAVADPRSVESLVDFSFSNIGWIQKAGDDGDDTRRLNKRRHEADAAKAQDAQLGEDYADNEEDDDVEEGILRLAQHERIPIDPALGDMSTPNVDSIDDEDRYEENPEAQSNTFAGKGPMVPQYVVPVPEGGILRDQDHVYQVTEAITYDYPDPDIAVALPVVEDQEMGPLGCVAAAPESPGKIEMVNRKRKRTKLDEGERAFTYRKGVAKLTDTPNKKRQSLIVKLPVNREKLADLNKMKLIAQRALNGVADIPAPVISSDLQALNTGYPTQEGQPQPNKKARNDQVFVERDDDFNPGRRRDRRKRGSGALPTTDADVTRRQTRMQAVTYEELESEEEFNDTVPDRPSRLLNSKLATMEKAADSTKGQDVEMVDEDGEFDFEPSPPPPPQPNVRHTKSASRDRSISREPARPAIQAPPTDRSPDIAPAPASKSTVRTIMPPAATAAVRRASTDVRPSTALSKTSNKAAPAKAIAEAEANRKAKMAAMHFVEDDDSLDDEWSDDEPARKPQSPMATPPVTTNTKPPATRLTTVAMKPQAATVPRQSPPNMASTRPTATSQLTQPPAIAKAFSAQKVSAADWDDSGSSDDDDDDDLPPVKTVVTSNVISGGGWASINGNHGGSANGNRVHVAGLEPATAKHGRGLGL